MAIFLVMQMGVHCTWLIITVACLMLKSREYYITAFSAMGRHTNQWSLNLLVRSLC